MSVLTRTEERDTAPTPLAKAVAWRRRAIVVVLAGLVFTASVVALGVGSVDLSVPRVLGALFGTGPLEDQRIIVLIRLPRILVGLSVGACLAVSGVLLQAVTRNALASPSIVGVSGGAGLAALLVISYVSGVTYSWLVPAAAFGGAALGGGLTYLLSIRDGTVNPERLALIGVSMGAMTAALIQLVIVLTAFVGDVQSALRWLTGSLWGRTWENVWQVTPFALLMIPLAWMLAHQLNLLGLGDDVPRTLGMRLEWAKLGLLGIAVVLAGAAVAVGGVIAFVGLVAPHLCRKLVGPGHQLLIPASALTGAFLVVVADILGRTLLAPTEIPVGLFTALIGAPYFLIQIRRGIAR